MTILRADEFLEQRTQGQSNFPALALTDALLHGARLQHLSAVGSRFNAVDLRADDERRRKHVAGDLVLVSFHDVTPSLTQL